MTIPQNPLLSLRLTSGKTQEVIGQNSHVSKQYISKCERGMAPKLNRIYLWTLIKASGIEITPKEVEFLYRAWQRDRREATIKFINPPPVAHSGAPDTASSQPLITNVPRNFQKFKLWRETYWKTAYEFSEAFCLRDSEVIKYEAGHNTYGMPAGIKKVLQPFGLLNGFDTTRR